MQRTIPIHIPPPLRHSDIWHLPNGFRPGLHPCPPQTREPVATRSGGRFRFVPCLVPPPGPEICSLARPGLSCPFPLPWYPAIVKAAGSGDGAEEKGRQKASPLPLPCRSLHTSCPSHIPISAPSSSLHEGGRALPHPLAFQTGLAASHVCLDITHTPRYILYALNTRTYTVCAPPVPKSFPHTPPRRCPYFFFLRLLRLLNRQPFCSYRSAGSSRRNSSSSSST
jgi:hypothetical protein